LVVNLEQHKIGPSQHDFEMILKEPVIHKNQKFWVGPAFKVPAAQLVKQEEGCATLLQLLV